MSEIPQTKDWMAPIKRKIDNTNLTEDQLLNLIRLCEDASFDIEPVYSFVRDQRQSVGDLLIETRRMYLTLYKKESPVRTKEELQLEEILDSPQRRKNEIRRIALEIAEHGQEITDEQVLEELKSRGKRLIADNPKATISTILWGFKSEFEKVPDKRSTFRRIGVGTYRRFQPQ